MTSTNQTNKTFKQKLDIFHETFDHPTSKSPTIMDRSTVLKRVNWTVEEIIEFLYATVKGNHQEFEELVDMVINGIDSTKNKIIKSGLVIDDVLTAQVDALLDELVYNQGSFSVMGVDPEPLFNIVHAANMGKLDKNGQPIIRESDGKIMKPDNWERDFAPEPRIKEELKRQLNIQS